MDRLDTINAFVQVATLGSFVAAADRLDISPQLVSKYVAQLEARIGGRLLNRTTRKVSLTEGGERYLVRAQQILADFYDMENEMGQLQSQATGRLRINAPVSFAERHLASLLSDFQCANPQVEIDLQLNDRRIDIVDEGFDIALRIGHLQDTSYIAKRLTPIKMVLCASPDYIAKHGMPDNLDALKSHHYLHYSHETSPPTALAAWIDLARKNGKQSFVCNNGDVLTAMAIRGAGIAIQPTFICANALARGDLVSVLPDHAPPTMWLYAIYAHRQLLASKVRHFIDFASDYYGDNPYWDACKNSLGD
ncbi:LysR family transcriptional regulator [Alteromonas sediminis]|uniref:LysR family transcriptional regulator n=1 Tax=Alteromonas sediminis TaxID=2259342 RepID=A0A3N5Z672_9ALTE|nr:LysR family transcriptional regulator [Alteromonas sediminis]RPJ66014.1 LysR family transcriptional regulator [Alteromonas sediminis]